MITIISEHLTHISDIKIYHRIFFHPDCTVGFGITPNHALRLVGFTTGRESHPALKICFLFTKFTIPLILLFCKRFFSDPVQLRF